jgi:hypothetical protein
VIPVGFLGLNLGSVRPPLSLLQGFNIRSHEGLNNLIAIANGEFGHAHKESFDVKDYVEVVGKMGGPDRTEGLSEYSEEIVEIQTVCETASDFGESAIVELGVKLENLLKSHHALVFRNKKFLRVPGLSLEINGDQLERGNARFTILISPSAFEKVLPTVKDIFATFATKGAKEISFLFKLSSNIEVVQSDHGVSGLLAKYDLRYSDNGMLALGGLVFNTGRFLKWRGGGYGDGFVNMIPVGLDLKPSEFSALLKILFNSGVLREVQLRVD